MNRKILLKILILILFALAILFGLAQRKQDPYVYNSRSKQQPSSAQDDLKYYYDKANKLAEQNNQGSAATFLAVGDIMLSRNVAATIKKANDPLLPFSKMADIFKSTDFNFANLESPIAPSGGIIGGHSMVFGSPKDYIQGLFENRFKILNLANNHALDQGIKGLDYTINYLGDNDIKHIGAGKNLTAAWQPAVVEQNGIKICFVGASYASVNDNGKTTNDYVARIEDAKNLQAMIYKLQAGCDFIVVTMHAGTEYARTPNATQIAFAHAAIDDGADMVIGSHPHWVQTTEKYRDKYIFYSLGNFIFDQMWSQDTKEGLAVKITVSKTAGNGLGRSLQADELQGSRIPARLDKIELLPIIIENFSTPRPATPDEAKRVLEKINVSDTIIKP